MDIRTKIKTICADKNITQKELAERHGDAYQTWSNKIHRNTMRFTEVDRIFEELGCELIVVDKETKKVY